MCSTCTALPRPPPLLIGFDLSEGALKTLLAHLVAPLAGAVLCSAWKMSLKIEIEFHKLLDKIKWSHDMVKPGEFVGSFFLVVLLFRDLFHWIVDALTAAVLAADHVAALAAVAAVAVQRQQHVAHRVYDAGARGARARVPFH